MGGAERVAVLGAQHVTHRATRRHRVARRLDGAETELPVLESVWKMPRRFIGACSGSWFS